MQKPQPGEYNPFFEGYIRLVEAGDFHQLLQSGHDQVTGFFRSIPASKHDYAYADGKWTVKEVLLHITDTERVMQYRALTIGRGDLESNLPGMDENLFAAEADVKGRSIEDLLKEFSIVRESTRLLFMGITEKQSQFTGRANGFPVTPRALGYIILGHSLHHLNVLSERYL